MQKPGFMERATKAVEAEGARIEKGEGAAPAPGPAKRDTTPPGVNLVKDPVANQTTEAPAVANVTTTEAPVANVSTQPPVVANQTTEAPLANVTTQPPAVAETPQQIAQRYLKEQGIDMDLDEMVTQLHNKPLTEEQKKKQQEQKDTTLLNRFIASGAGTMDDFYGIRSLKDMADADLVKADFLNEAQTLDPNLTDEDAEEMFNKRYFIGEEGDYNANEVKMGQHRISQTAKAIRDRKNVPLAKIEAEMTYEAEAIKERKAWEKNVDQFAATDMPKSFTVNLGKMGNSETDLGDFTYNLSDEEQKEFVSDLKDPAYLIRQISNDTGKTDLKKLFDLLAWAKIGKKAIKAASYDNFSKGVDKVAAPLDNFPNLNSLGAGASGEAQQEIQKGQQQIREDSRNILGPKPRRRSFSSGG